MSNQLEVIQKTIYAPETQRRLMLALGAQDSKDQTAIAETKRYMASVLAEIEKTAGDEKKDLTVCNAYSIAQCMIDAARFRMMIDGRQYAHLVKYGKNATLQIGYRGYLAKIKEHYPDADFVVVPVYKGDVLKIWEESGVQQYTLERKQAFRDGDADFEGILFAVTYTEGGRLVRKVNAVSKGRIDRARKAAKQDFIWASDYIEKAKAAAIKASCKHLFASLQGLQDVVRYDNEKNYSLSDSSKPEIKDGGNIVENINKALQNDIIEHDDDAPAPPAPKPCAKCNGTGSTEWTDEATGETGIEPCPECKA